ncbi:hypothetical protein Nepgr_016342 [Nepenthes gracilis]|uniref:Uncharacterized protein n=1 Tax=Nepenthes gracilis TaxID=150966 RepID=A0AAD3SQ47_NEPGR|nr:hypothetical protein Nepgr_016342 [Nepenthes gracilis]
MRPRCFLPNKLRAEMLITSRGLFALLLSVLEMQSAVDLLMVEYPWKPGQNVPSRIPRTSKTHSKSPHKANPSGRLPPPVFAVKGSGVKDPLSPTRNSATLGQTAGLMPTPNPSKANSISLADNDPVLVDGISPSACNEYTEANNLEGDSLKLSISKSETSGTIDSAALDSNSFEALTSPEADTLLCHSAGSGTSETNYPVESAPVSILTGGVLVPPSEPPLVVDSSCSSQNLPSGEPLLHNEVQLDKVPRPPPPSLPTLEVLVRPDVCRLNRTIL